MTKQEFDEMAALVVRLRKELEHTNQHLVAHIDALTKSNAQCGEYLRKTEQMQAEHERLLRVCNDYEDAAADMHSELVEVRAALASATEQRDSLQRTLDEWERADTKPHERVAAEDVADHVVPPVLPMCMTCHGCGGPLYQAHPENGELPVGCRMKTCSRDVTARHSVGCIKRDDPYRGPCKSAQPVRHE